MNDINFFAPYKGKAKKEEKNNGNDKKIIIAVGVIAGLVIVGSFLFNMINIYSLNASIAEYNDKLNASELQQKLKESEELDKKIAVLDKYDSNLVSIGTSIDKRDAVSNDILDSLSSTLPSDVYFKSFSIDAGNITVQAVSKTRQAIGEIEHNLRQLTNVSDVYVGSITSAGGDAVDGQYSFDIKITLKGVK